MELNDILQDDHVLLLVKKEHLTEFAEKLANRLITKQATSTTIKQETEKPKKQKKNNNKKIPKPNTSPITTANQYFLSNSRLSLIQKFNFFIKQLIGGNYLGQKEIE